MRSDLDVPRPPNEPLIFRHRTGAWDLTWRARVVGILNLTPDSFYDGGRYATSDAALARAEAMASEGADAIDVGGQSTRPGATPLSAEEEWVRLEEILPTLVKRVPLPFSIDTYHAEVARRALDVGVAIVNDVSGLWVDPSVVEAAAQAGAGLVVMHSQGAPSALHAPQQYRDVVEEIRAFLEKKSVSAQSWGVSLERIAIDPGIGFSKNAEQSVAALAGIPRYVTLGRPVYIGISRKSFLGALTGEPVEGRLAAALAVTVNAYRDGARIFRTHDVKETVEALRAVEKIEEARATEVART